MAVLVHPADEQDRDGGKRLLEQAHSSLPRVQKIWLDQGYQGRCARWIRQELGWNAEVVRPQGDREHGHWRHKSDPPLTTNKGFQVVHRRWAVERTFAWFGRCRRLSKDYEELIETATAWVWIAALRILLRRFARSLNI